MKFKNHAVEYIAELDFILSLASLENNGTNLSKGFNQDIVKLQ
jgi:hypothetical protein